MENIIITSIKKPLLNNKNLNFLNNQNDCVICTQNIQEKEYIILINNLCKCYNAVKICQDCLFTWISNNNQCFICRHRYNITYNHRHKIYHTHNNDLNKKLLDSLNKKANYSSIDIGDNSSENDIRLLENRYTFLNSEIFIRCINNNKYVIMRHMFCYSFFIFVFISINRTIFYEKQISTNSTYPIIY